MLATARRRLRAARTIPAARPTGNLDVLEPDVVFREGRRCLLRGADIGELRQLQPGVELVSALEAVQHRGHEPGEVLGPPDAPESVRRVALQQGAVTVSVPGGDSRGEQANIRDREVEAFRARGRNDVSRVAGEEEAPVLHGLHNDASHPGDSLFEHLPRVQRPALEPEAQPKLLPDPVVGPLVEVFVGPYLEVEARHLRRTHAVQGEAALVVCIDQLLVRRRRGGQDPEPCERVFPLERSQDAGRNAVAADSVEAVAPGDEVAAQLDLVVVVPEADQREVRVDLGDLDVVDLEVQRPTRLESRGDQVFDHFLLTVDGDPPAAGQGGEVDPVALTGELDLDPVVNEPFPSEPLANADLVQQVDRSLLEHTGPDPVLNVLAAAVFEHDRVDALQMQKLRQHESGGTGTDDPDLGALLPQPQISSAVSTTSWSFATWSSCVTRLPSTVDEKPHCGERQSWSRAT